jgi:hypothetical protein
VRGLKGLTPLLLIGIAGLAWLLFLSEPGSHWLTSVLVPPPTPGPVIGRVMTVEGSGKRVHGGDVAELRGPIKAPFDLHDGDRVETDATSNTLLMLNSQDEIKLPALSSVTFQLWNEQDPASAIYITVLAGDVELQRAGVRGRAYVVRDGRLYLPGQKSIKKALALTVLRSAPLDMTLSGEGTAASGITAANDFESETADTVKPDSGFASEPETLSNEYIDEMITSRQGQLQKCWLSRLKDKPGLKGQLVLQLEINRRGKVKDVKVTDSTLGDETLNKCVITVLERIPFRSFKGSEISLSYPIGFE